VLADRCGGGWKVVVAVVGGGNVVEEDEDEDEEWCEGAGSFSNETTPAPWNSKSRS
jgi:hypothetical protein